MQCALPLPLAGRAASWHLEGWGGGKMEEGKKPPPDRFAIDLPRKRERCAVLGTTPSHIETLKKCAIRFCP